MPLSPFPLVRVRALHFACFNSKRDLHKKQIEPCRPLIPQDIFAIDFPVSDYLLNFVASRPHLYDEFLKSFLGGEFQSLVDSMNKAQDETAAHGPKKSSHRSLKGTADLPLKETANYSFHATPETNYFASKNLSYSHTSSIQSNNPVDSISEIACNSSGQTHRQALNSNPICGPSKTYGSSLQHYQANSYGLSGNQETQRTNVTSSNPSSGTRLCLATPPPKLFAESHVRTIAQIDNNAFGKNGVLSPNVTAVENKFVKLGTTSRKRKSTQRVQMKSRTASESGNPKRLAPSPLLILPPRNLPLLPTNLVIDGDCDGDCDDDESSEETWRVVTVPRREKGASAYDSKQVAELIGLNFVVLQVKGTVF